MMKRKASTILINLFKSTNSFFFQFLFFIFYILFLLFIYLFLPPFHYYLPLTIC